MNELDKFYKSTYFTHNTVDRCIHCHRHDTVQVIIQMEIDGYIHQGPFCKNCYSANSVRSLAIE